MTREVLNDSEFFGIQRGKINANFLELYTNMIVASDILKRNNTTVYTPINPYNPATKLYVDSNVEALINRYDPTGIEGDAFDRSKHYGSLLPSVITQDPDNRFVTDFLITTWNNKEPSIGTKGTSFNKNFGTTAGTTAEGNHGHTGYETADPDIQTHITQNGNAHNMVKADIGLSNADDIGNINRVYSDFIPKDELNKPVHKEGRVYYDEEHHCLTFFPDIDGVSVSLGSEFVGRVYNRSGFTIPNGTPIRFAGTVTNHVPDVLPAKSDNFSTSQCCGITTHDIPHLSEGLKTCMGVVHEIDTTIYPTGTILYLSDLTEGSFTSTRPEIITMLGTVLDSGVQGSIFVNIASNMTVPTTLGALDTIAATYNLTTSYQGIVNYTNSDKVVTLVDKTTGLITLPLTGKYRATVNTTLLFAASTQTRTVLIQLWNNTSNTEIGLTSINIPKDSTTSSRSFSKLFNGIEGNSYSLRIRALATLSGVTFSDASIDITSVYVAGN